MSDEIDDLKRASEGLEYPSESDAPFDLVQWGAGGGSAMDQVRSRAGDRKIEEVQIDAFFAGLEGSDQIERFQELRETVVKSLTDVHIFRVGAGETKVDIYLVGKTRDGKWAGLHTTSVET